MTFTLSSEVSPEMREYERFSTACANAYVQPMIGRYLADLEALLRDAGLSLPALSDAVGRRPDDGRDRDPLSGAARRKSGPAGGAIFAGHIARQCGLDKVLSYDMGGTTAKICLIDELQPQTSRAFEVARVYRFKKGSGLPLRIPVIEMVEIGAGGGSIARVDRLKRITVGPDSAGADPGPACYGRGGALPTVTDADLLLGRIDPTGFSGGRMALDRRAAEAAIEREVGRPARSRAVARGVRGQRDRRREHGQRRPRPRDRKRQGCARPHPRRVWWRGAAACRRAWPTSSASTGCWCRRTPGSARRSGFCARRSPTRSCARNCSGSMPLTRTRPTRCLAAMRTEAEAIVRLGEPHAPLAETRSAFMRYRGQGHEIAVPVPSGIYRAEDAGVLLAAFEAAYRALYSRVIPGVEVEVLSWVLLLSGPVPHEDADAPPLPSPSHPAPARRRAVFDPDNADFIEVAIYERAALAPGAVIPGPAVIVEDETSTVVGRLFDARIDAFGYIELTRHGG